jgi:hypothetical protein
MHVESRSRAMRAILIVALLLFAGAAVAAENAIPRQANQFVLVCW